MHLASFVSALAFSTLAVVSAQAPTQSIVDNVKALNSTVEGKKYTLSNVLKFATSVPAVATAITEGKNFTLFAPTDEAFKAFSVANPKAVLAFAGSPDVLGQALMYHVVNTPFNPAGQPAKQFVETASTHNYIQVNVAGNKVNVGYDGGNATVIDSIPSSNGVIHVVDHVFSPPRSAAEVAKEAGLTTLVAQVVAANLTDAVADVKGSTLFAPTNKAFDTVLEFAKKNNLALNETTLAAILKFHVVPGVYFSTDIAKAKTASIATLLSGQNVTVTAEGNEVKVIGAGQTALKLEAAEVEKADILIKGGVAHVIDAVLVPDLAAAASTGKADAVAANEPKNAAGHVKASVGVAAAAIVGAFAFAL